MNATAVWASLGALVLPAAAAADDSGVYAGGGIGYVDMPDRVQLAVPNVPLLPGKVEQPVFEFGLQIGYRFNRNIAVELGYVELGALEANVADTSGGSDASARLEFSADGVSLALLGLFPINQWEPYVKAGVLFASTTLKYSGSVSGQPFSREVDNDAEDALYGLGMRYSLTEQLRLYVDSTFFMEVGDRGRGQSDFFKTSAGVIWQF